MSAKVLRPLADSDGALDIVTDPDVRPPPRPYRNAGPMFSLKKDFDDWRRHGRAVWRWMPGDEPDPLPPPRKVVWPR